MRMGHVIAVLSLAMLAVSISPPALALGVTVDPDTCSESGVLPAGVDVDGPAFLSDQTVRMAGSASDLFAFAQYVNIPGEVRDNTFSFAQKFNLQGAIDGDLFAFAQNLDIKGEVGGDIWEFKRHQVRIMCFQVGRRMVLTHGFRKKENRTPRRQIERAERIRAEHLRREGSRG